MELNEEQKEIVNHIDGPCLITAIPGSGKTFSIVERTINLIEKGIDPKSILCITFSNKAARNMRERICKRLGISKPSFFIGTFHSLCAKILRKLGHYNGFSSNYVILDENDQKDYIFQISKKIDIKLEKKEINIISYSVNNYRDRLEKIEELENRLQNNPNYIKIAKAYLDILKKHNVIDFAGLIYETIQLIEQRKEIREVLQNKFKYLQVDEVQDTSYSQFHLVNLLSAKWNNIAVIGDINQSVYGWRSARYQNVLDFLNKHENCKNLSLSNNYRSTPEIIEKAYNLIKHNSNNMIKDFTTNNSSGDKVICVSCYDQFEETDFVARKIKYFIDEEGWDYNHIAILYRMNSLSEAFEQAFIKNGIPYEVIGSRSFYDRKEIRDCLALLKFLVNPKDRVAFYRVCSLIKGIGGGTVSKIEDLSKEENMNILSACKKIQYTIKSTKIKNACVKISDIFDIDYKNKNAAECLLQFVNKLDYKKYLYSNFDLKSAENKIENVKQFIDSAGNAAKNYDSVENYLQALSLMTSSDKESKKGKVSLMTMHASKGLEFEIVFCVSVEENIIPHKLSLQENYEENICEERRLLYVSITRSKSKLLLSFCQKRKKYGKHGMYYQDTKPSRFLYEAKLLKEDYNNGSS